MEYVKSLGGTKSRGRRIREENERGRGSRLLAMGVGISRKKGMEKRGTKPHQDELMTGSLGLPGAVSI
jgi:hypothetical protein